MHIGVGSTASTSSASFFATATRCFSDSAHASVDPASENADTLSITANTTRCVARDTSYFSCASEEGSLSQ